MLKSKLKLKVIIFIISLVIITLISSCSCSNNSTNNTVPVYFQFNSSCDYEKLIPGEIVKEIELVNFILIGTDATLEEIIYLKNDPCVMRAFKVSELSTVLGELREEMDADREQMFKDVKLNRSLEKKDVVDKDELRDIMEEKHPNETLSDEILSQYQLYVTPDSDAVQELVMGFDSIQEIYDESLSWVWVSEEYLNGVSEYWYYPEEFLTETPYLESNPAPGQIASDCSEQANTLVSLLIASEFFDEEDVRVVLGIIRMDDQLGGHAWVEINQKGDWFALEATSGSYYDEISGNVVEGGSIPYKYFKFTDYPVVEVWYYYNNAYFWDEDMGLGDAPRSWQGDSDSSLLDELEGFASSRPDPKISKKG